MLTVLAVLTVSYASSLRAYLDQREHLGELQATIEQRQGEIDELEREQERWQDPAFVEAQARARLGYVRPGDTPFVVLRDGRPIGGEAELSDPAELPAVPPRAWWDDIWDSAVLAGDPPRQTRPPAREVDGTQEPGGGSD